MLDFEVHFLPSDGSVHGLPCLPPPNCIVVWEVGTFRVFRLALDVCGVSFHGCLFLVSLKRVGIVQLFAGMFCMCSLDQAGYCVQIFSFVVGLSPWPVHWLKLTPVSVAASVFPVRSLLLFTLRLSYSVRRYLGLSSFSSSPPPPPRHPFAFYCYGDWCSFVSCVLAQACVQYECSSHGSSAWCLPGVSSLDLSGALCSRYPSLILSCIGTFSILVWWTVF